MSLNAQSLRDDEGEAAGTEGFIRDITERKQTEAGVASRAKGSCAACSTIRQAARRSTPEVRGDGSRGSDYIIKDFNATSLRIEGKTKDEVVGKSLLDLRPTIEEYGLIPVLQRVCAVGGAGPFASTLYIDERYANWYENRVFRLPLRRGRRDL